jgi:hypothetical protein
MPGTAKCPAFFYCSTLKTLLTVAAPKQWSQSRLRNSQDDERNLINTNYCSGAPV